LLKSGHDKAPAMAQYCPRIIGNQDGIMAAKRTKKKSGKVSKKKAKKPSIRKAKKAARKPASKKKRAPAKKARARKAPVRRRLAIPTVADIAPSGEPEFVSNLPPVKL
jgi:hypothetical protein